MIGEIQSSFFSAGHYDDSREMEVEGETIVYEEVTLYYPRPNRLTFMDFGL